MSGSVGEVSKKSSDRLLSFSKKQQIGWWQLQKKSGSRAEDSQKIPAPAPSSLSKRGDYPPALPPIRVPFPVELRREPVRREKP
jgi:hypothetical protein